jgi:hypothetical protein
VREENAGALNIEATIVGITSRKKDTYYWFIRNHLLTMQVDTACREILHQQNQNFFYEGNAGWGSNQQHTDQAKQTL